MNLVTVWMLSLSSDVDLCRAVPALPPQHLEQGGQPVPAQRELCRRRYF
jgi:hypothetical protein